MEFQDYENLLKHVYRTAPIGLCLFDKELRYRHVNEWLAAINGVSVEAHLGRTIREVIPDVSAEVESVLRRVMETGEPVLDGVVEAETPSSPHRKRTFLHSYHAVRSDKGSVVGVSCVVQDITDRTRAEEALVEANAHLENRDQARTEELIHSELRQRHLLESTRAVPWEADATTFQFTYVGPQAVGLLGFPSRQWFDTDFWSRNIHPEDRASATDYCMLSAKTETDFDFEYRMIATDGRLVWIHDIVNVEFEAGEPRTLRGFMIDITDRKQAEAALRENVTRLQLATDATHIGHWDHDLRTNEVYFSPEWKRQLGYEDHELANQFGVWESHLHPDDRAITKMAYKDYIAQRQEKYEIEFRLRHKDGSYRWIYTRGEKLLDDAGTPCRILGCHVDITERKQTEELLKVREARFRMIYEHAPVMIDAFDDRGRCVMFNKECEKVFGWTEAEVMAHENPLELFYPDPDIRRQVTETVTSKPEKVFREWKQIRKDGSEVPSLWANFKLPDGLVINLGYDISERKQAQEKFMRLLEATPDAMVIVNTAGEIILINRQTERLFGYERDELVGQPIELLLPHHLRETHVEHLKGYFHDPRPRAMGSELDLFALHKDGHEVPVEISLSPCETDEGMIVISSVRDISERKKSVSLLRAHRNTLQALARKLFSAHEDERRRLARELHDDLSQRLAAVGMDSVSLERDVRKISESCADQVAALHGRIRKISADIHQMSHQLHPSILEDLGLVKAMKGECDAFTRRTGISISFTPPGEYAGVERNTELTIYRVMQECLQNIAKHSRALSAQVELTLDGENISLNVRDSGIGFELKEAGSHNGLGLSSISERVELLGGNVSFESEVGKGTTVQVTIPKLELTS